MKKNRKNFHKGFTLIELLVAILIVAILAALAFTSYSSAQKSARDARRRSDLEQYRNSLLAYAANNDGKLPGNGSDGDTCNETGIFDWPSPTPGVLIPAYLPEKIEDPLSKGSCALGCGTNGADSTAYCKYRYFGTSDRSTYVLEGGLENGGVWQICSGGKTGLVPSSTCVNSYDTVCRDAVCDVQ